MTDHLGSVKAVVNGNNGNLYEVNNYTVYGKQSANSSASSYISTAPSGEKFREHFTGKEDQAPDFTVPFTDFGARQYSPALRRWLVPDPLSEKYYGVSPYAYCAGNPVNLVDILGGYTKVAQNPDGTYTVVGGELDDDLNVYIYSKDSEGEYTIRGESIGQTAFASSFYSEEEQMWQIGSVIDLTDMSGEHFLKSIIQTSPDFFTYMYHARNGEIYDFKETNGLPGGHGFIHYRGMQVNGVIMSARDIGNFAAGYISGLNNIPYFEMRFFFDAYQSLTDTVNYNVKQSQTNSGQYRPAIFLSRESKSSRKPQFAGWLLGTLAKGKKR